jgi:hypothetical protein
MSLQSYETIYRNMIVINADEIRLFIEVKGFTWKTFDKNECKSMEVSITVCKYKNKENTF